MVKTTGFAYFILIPKAGALNRVLLAEIENIYHPDYIVLSDFLNFSFCERHYGLSHNDLNVFKGKIGAFDLYDFSNSDRKLDTYGFFAKDVNALNLDSYEFLLKPCPVNKISSGLNEDGRHSLFGNIKIRDDLKKRQARDVLGFKKGEKVVFMTFSRWQHTYNSYGNVKPFIELCNKALEDIILGFPENTRFVSIGYRTLFLDGGPCNVTHYDAMHPDNFKAVTDAADLFISNNYISTSMLKMALSGIPTLLLSNSCHIRGDEVHWISKGNKERPGGLKDCFSAYPFRMFPVGWYKFLEKIVRENNFYSFVYKAELFDREQAQDQINLSLEGSDFNHEEMRTRYLRQLEGLKPVYEFLN